MRHSRTHALRIRHTNCSYSASRAKPQHRFLLPFKIYNRAREAQQLPQLAAARPALAVNRAYERDRLPLLQEGRWFAIESLSMGD